MTTQSYCLGGELDGFHRPSHRMPSLGAYYERPVPYGYYDQRLDHRPEYGGAVRHIPHTMIQEPEPDGAGAQSRRRIAVACARCRKRKIKCTGDPLDGTGCQACKTSGADVSACVFNRVGSEGVHFSDPPTFQAVPHSTGGGLESSTGFANGSNNYHQSLTFRPSLPLLHTRSAYPADYEPQYHDSPVEGYAYSSTGYPRHDSYNSIHSTHENYRFYSSSAPISMHSGARFSDSSSAVTFGGMHSAAYPQTPSSRLPSVTAESMSALNMGSLNSSLPVQTVQERRLPVPCPAQHTQPPCSAQPLPEIRSIDPSAGFRAHINGIHSRTAMPWTSENDAYSASRNTSISTAMPATSLPATSGQAQSATTTSLAEPVLGYQFQHSARYSPDISPTSAADLSEGLSGSSSSASIMLPPSSNSMRYISSLSGAETISGNPADARRRSSAQQDGATCLYSFSTEAAAGAGVAPVDRAGSAGCPRRSEDRSAREHDDGGAAGELQYGPLRQRQHRHGGSRDALRQQASFERQQQRAATAHRISVSNLSTRY